MNGNVKFFNESKGFGFIIAEDSKEYFVHISGINNNAVLRENDAVTFDVEQGDRGPKAVNVSLGSAPATKEDVAEEVAEEAAEEPVED